MNPANHSLNPDSSSATLLATREWLTVGLFAAILLITMFASNIYLMGFVARFDKTSGAGLGQMIRDYMFAAALAAGPFGVAFGLIATLRTTILAILAALPPTVATVALNIWTTGVSVSFWWLPQLRNAAFLLVFVATASLVDHFVTGMAPKKRVTIGVVLFAGLSVASLIAMVIIVLLGLAFGAVSALFLWLCFIASVVAAVFAFAIWRETRKGRGT